MTTGQPKQHGGDSTSPVPSITLQITKEDADRFLQASGDIAATLEQRNHDGLDLLEAPPPPTPHQATAASARGKDDFIATTTTTLPLHERLYEAALACKYQSEPVQAFLDRIDSSALPLHEQKAALLLLHAAEMEEKLRCFFDALSDNDHNNNSQSSLSSSLHNKEQLVSFFRSILSAITCSCGTGTTTTTLEEKVIVEGRPDSSRSNKASDDDDNDEHHHQPPKKRFKRGGGDNATASTKESTENSKDLRNCQSPSFDSSLATLHDEDHHHHHSDGGVGGNSSVRREIDEVAEYAAEQLFQYATTQQQPRSSSRTDCSITVDIFHSWYDSSGSEIAPWMELLSISKWDTGSGHAAAKAQTSSSSNIKPLRPHPLPTTTEKHSAASAYYNNDEGGSSGTTSRTLVSFDFSGSQHPTPLCINISEDNIYTLRNFVHRTGLMNIPAAEMCKNLLRLATRRSFGDQALLTLRRDVWVRSIDELIGGETWSQLSPQERDAFTASLVDVFSCFEGSKSFLRSDEVDLQEFAVGFCFFCKGKKSKKLATGFEMLDDQRKNYLSEEELLRYLISYLTMLVGMSFLTPITKQQFRIAPSEKQQKQMRSAVENGARWTLSHFLKSLASSDPDARRDRYSFEKFATWYSNGGYEVAPWLELLDLTKVFSLLSPACDSPIGLSLSSGATTEQKKLARDRVSSLRRHHSSRGGPPPEILFTFPLATHRSLIVLKDDATYVRGVVEQLGLLSMNPDDLWTSLSEAVESKHDVDKNSGGATYVDTRTFVKCMQDICTASNSRKRSHPGTASASEVDELVSNFYQCFDLDQTDNVALDELMGGLTLLCGGKKSHKLAFAFGVFDTRPGIHEKKKKESITHSLSGEDLFLFLRSILIVTFSCCRQSLDMTDAMVGQCIADTANMICNDVMRHQWDLRQKDRLNFDEFGQWYNDGGFERAPWLELLDLNKWVLVDNFDTLKKQPPREPKATTSSDKVVPLSAGSHNDCDVPPPPPEDSLDPDFFEKGIMGMDSMDEMDMILMQPSKDHETDLSPRIKNSFSFSPRPSPEKSAPSLKFHLHTKESDGGYLLSLSQRRICHLRSILETSSLHKMEAEVVCNRVLAKATKSKTPRLTKENFESAISSLLAGHAERALSDILLGVFAAFDRESTGKVSAIEVACGFTVLCSGKKSDKLEFAFEVLDKRKKGHLNKADMTNYLKAFLTVLLSIAFAPGLDDDSNEATLTTLKGRPCDSSFRTMMNVVESGAQWAATMAFDGCPQNGGSGREPSMSFDDFADWYTNVGHSSIPWLELLDLKKWLFC